MYVHIYLYSENIKLDKEYFAHMPIMQVCLVTAAQNVQAIKNYMQSSK